MYCLFWCVLWKNNGFTQYPQSLNERWKWGYECNRPTGCNARRSKYYTLDCATFQPHSSVYIFVYLLNVSIYPICHHIMVHSYKTQAQVKQFPERWWKRKPLKMLFVYGKQVFSLVYIFMLFTFLLYTGVRKMKLQANRNRLF